MEQAFEVGIIQRTNIPRLRFPNFNSSWENIKLGNIAKIIMGQSPIGDSYNFKGEGVPLINGPGEFTEKYPVKIKWTDKPIRFCEKSDILFCVRGSSTGRVNIANDSYCIGRGIAAIRANQYSNLNFLEYSVERNLKDLLVFAVGSTFINLDNKSLSEFRVYTPSLPEQTKIGSFISTVDEKLQALKKKKRLLEEFKKGIMQKLFSQELRFKDENGEEFPEWELKKLNKVCNIRNGLTCDQSNLYKGYRVTRIETISEGIINLKKLGFIGDKENIEDYRIRKGDILFSNINSVSHIGKTAIAFADLDIYHGMNLLCLRSQTTFDPFFIFHYLNTEQIRNYFRRICNQAVNQASINQTQLGETELLLPCLTEQKRISDLLSSLDKKMAMVNQQIAQAQSWKKGLLQKMFC